MWCANLSRPTFSISFSISLSLNSSQSLTYFRVTTLPLLLISSFSTYTSQAHVFVAKCIAYGRLLIYMWVGHNSSRHEGKLTLLLTAGASPRRRTHLRTLGPLFARRSADTRRQDGDVDLASGRVNSRLLQRFTVQPYNTQRQHFIWLCPIRFLK